MLNCRERTKLLGEVFNPNAAPDAFERMYRNVSNMVDKIGEEATASLLDKFDVRAWMKTTPSTSREAREGLMRTIVESFPKTEEGVVLTSHRRVVRDFLAASPQDLVVDALHLAIGRAVTGNIRPEVFHDMVRALNEDVAPNRNILDTTELLQTNLSRDQLLSVATELSSQFSAGISKRGNAIYSVAVPYFDSFVDLAIIIFASAPLFSMATEIHHEELWATLQNLALPFMGIVRKESQHGYHCVSPWTPETADIAGEFLAVFAKLVGKVCRNSVVSERTPTLLWRFYVVVFNAQSPSFVVNALHRQYATENWESFHVSGVVADQILEWVKQQRLTVESQRFLSSALMAGRWLSDGSLQAEVGAGDAYLMNMLNLIFSFGVNAVSLYPDNEDRQRMFDAFSVKCFKVYNWQRFMPSQFAEIVQTLPEDWTPASESSTVMTAESEKKASPLLYALKFLRIMAGIDNWPAVSGPVTGESGHEITYSKLELYVDYVLGLLARQTSVQMALDALSPPCRTFADESIGDVLMEVLQLAESDSSNPPHQARGVALRHVMQRSFALLNASERGSRTFNRLWDGLARACRASRTPILIISVACQTVASAEHMALLVETCIERQLSLTRDPEAWRAVMSAFTLPDLETDAFVRHCHAHALVLTLYAHALQKLEEYNGNPDLRVVVGEQLGNWIGKIKIETAEDGKEAKVVLLLAQFAQLLGEELSSLPLPEHHSRLRAQSAGIADALLRWGEDRASQGLWATLGFGPRSRLSVDFRLFARAVGTFIATRLLGSGPANSEQKARLIAGVASLQHIVDYEKVARHVEPVVEFLQDDGRGIGALPELLGWLIRLLFPEYHMMGLPM
ncbi:Ectopic P granules protein 5 [Borealophlyctis nickersoniae]|nr:Ectopic P granules protein 5 [Borealophlyctis nickersoniae]